MIIPDPKFKKGDKVQFVGYEKDTTESIPIPYGFYGIIVMLHTYNHQCEGHTYCVKITKGKWKECFEDRYPEVYEKYLKHRIKIYRKPTKRAV
jgi:hypothetical protein